MLARALSVSINLFMLVDSVNQLGVYLGIIAWTSLYLCRPGPGRFAASRARASA